MQSSNSSDALLMNFFCHPKINTWKGAAKLFDTSSIADISFGVNPNLKWNNKSEKVPTEIDMQINDNVYCEAKLTEKDFTSKSIKTVKAYDDFDRVFNRYFLIQTKSEYLNYQLIRNILAVYKNERSFYLICDARRPDLIRSFYETVRCVRDNSLRNRCNFITWQDLTKVVGDKNFYKFLKEKYVL